MFISFSEFFSSYPAMGVALYRWGVMAQSNSSSDSSLGEESLRQTSAGAEFQSLTVRGKKENWLVFTLRDLFVFGVTFIPKFSGLTR